MTADELIDSYVANVVMLLPRQQRRDVAQELRMLLREEAGAVLIPIGALLNELTRQAEPQRDLGRAIEKAWPGVFA